ncbi:CDP-alcohol phosphatidyltransferase family protein [Rhizomicrobium electricum]|jgi:hypothetical protein|uniref:CDP-alcohol phosphatidyltransferase family protein n=1 Tax=Rhizomicrobium electricum TaxID=480070 RepID=A0ABN1EPK5_9PROT|nr:hypothetical protein [Rhizomicrobium electricum]
MLDALLEKLGSPVLDRCAARIADHTRILELVSFCVGLAAVPLIARHFVWIGLAVFAAGRLIAAVAARANKSDLADIYRTVAYAALPFAFVLDAPVRALPAVFLMFGLAANGAVAVKFGRSLVGAAELLILFVLASAFPAWFGLIAYAGGVLCFVAAGVEASRRI